MEDNREKVKQIVSGAGQETSNQIEQTPPVDSTQPPVASTQQPIDSTNIGAESTPAQDPSLSDKAKSIAMMPVNAAADVFHGVKRFGTALIDSRNNPVFSGLQAAFNTPGWRSSQLQRSAIDAENAYKKEYYEKKNIGVDSQVALENESNKLKVENQRLSNENLELRNEAILRQNAINTYNTYIVSANDQADNDVKNFLYSDQHFLNLDSKSQKSVINSKPVSEYQQIKSLLNLMPRAIEEMEAGQNGLMCDYVERVLYNNGIRVEWRDNNGKQAPYFIFENKENGEEMEIEATTEVISGIVKEKEKEAVSYINAAYNQSEAGCQTLQFRALQIPKGIMAQNGFNYMDCARMSDYMAKQINNMQDAPMLYTALFLRNIKEKFGGEINYDNLNPYDKNSVNDIIQTLQHKAPNFQVKNDGTVYDPDHILTNYSSNQPDTMSIKDAVNCIINTYQNDIDAITSSAADAVKAEKQKGIDLENKNLLERRKLEADMLDAESRMEAAEKEKFRQNLESESYLADYFGMDKYAFNQYFGDERKRTQIQRLVVDGKDLYEKAKNIDGFMDSQDFYDELYKLNKEFSLEFDKLDMGSLFEKAPIKKYYDDLCYTYGWKVISNRNRNAEGELSKLNDELKKAKETDTSIKDVRIASMHGGVPTWMSNYEKIADIERKIETIRNNINSAPITGEELFLALKQLEKSGNKIKYGR